MWRPNHSFQRACGPCLTQSLGHSWPACLVLRPYPRIRPSMLLYSMSNSCTAFLHLMHARSACLEGPCLFSQFLGCMWVPACVVGRSCQKLHTLSMMGFLSEPPCLLLRLLQQFFSAAEAFKQLIPMSANIYAALMSCFMMILPPDPSDFGHAVFHVSMFARSHAFAQLKDWSAFSRAPAVLVLSFVEALAAAGLILPVDV